MADLITSQIAMVDPLLTSNLGLPENQLGPDIMSLISPEVQVYNRMFKTRVFGKDMYRRVAKVSRPRGGDAERVTTEYVDPKAFSTDEKTLRDVVDARDIREAANAPDGGFDLRLRTALMIQQNLHTTIEANAAAMFLDDANYGAGNKSAIGTTFSGTGTVAAVRDAQSQIIRTWAVRPSLLIMTPEAWAEAQSNTTLNNRVMYTNGETFTEDMVAKQLQVDKIIVPYRVWFESAAADAVGSFIWAGKKALLLYANPQAGMNGPSFAKTFYQLVEGQREYAKTAFDMPGNEHIYVARDEETYIVFPDAAFLWY